MTPRALVVVFATVVGLFLVAWWNVITATQDPMWDEGTFHYVGWLWFSGTGLPWRDAWENKPPLVFALHGLAHLVSPLPLITARLVSGATLVGTAFLLRQVAMNLGVGAAGWAAPLFLVAAFGPALESHAAQTEPLMVMLSCAAMFQATRTGVGLRGPVLAGVFASLAVLAKQPALVEAGLVMLLVGRPGVDGATRRVLAWMGAFLVPQVAVLAWTTASGITGDYLAGCWGFLGTGASGPPNWASRFTMVSGLFNWMGARNPLFLLAGALAWRGGEPGSSRATRVGLAWLACAAPGVLAGWTWGHQVLALAPPLVLLASAGLGRVHAAAPAAGHGMVAVGLVMTLLGNMTPLAQRLTAETRDSVEPLAQSVRDHSVPGETLLVYPLNDDVYARAERRAATRYFNPNFLAVGDNAQRQRDELLAHPPALVLLNPSPWAPAPFFHSPAEDRLRQNHDAWLRAFVDGCYGVVDTPGGWALLRRRLPDATPCPAPTAGAPAPVPDP